jgi:hypothetical protein
MKQFGCLIPSTSNGRAWKDYKESYLYKTTLNSFLRTYSKEFKTHFYIGIDPGDPIYDTTESKENFKRFIDVMENVSIESKAHHTYFAPENSFGFSSNPSELITPSAFVISRHLKASSRVAIFNKLRKSRLQNIFRNRFVIAAESLCDRFAIDLKLPRNHCTIVLRSLWISPEPLCDRFAIASQLKRNF